MATKKAKKTFKAAPVKASKSVLHQELSQKNLIMVFVVSLLVIAGILFINNQKSTEMRSKAAESTANCPKDQVSLCLEKECTAMGGTAKTVVAGGVANPKGQVMPCRTKVISCNFAPCSNMASQECKNLRLSYKDKYASCTGITVRPMPVK